MSNQNPIKSITSLTGIKLVALGNGSAVISAKNLAKLVSIVDGSERKAQLSAIALKAVETRRANKLAAKRSEAARKANVTRKFAKLVNAEIAGVVSARKPGTPMFSSPITSASSVAKRFNEVTPAKAKAMLAKHAPAALKVESDMRAERLSAIALKAWETRRANAKAQKHSARARKAWATRRAAA